MAARKGVGASMRGRILTSMCNDTQVVKVERLSIYSKRITGSGGDGRRVSGNIVISPRKSGRKTCLNAVWFMDRTVWSRWETDLNAVWLDRTV